MASKVRPATKIKAKALKPLQAKVAQVKAKKRAKITRAKNRIKANYTNLG